MDKGTSQYPEKLIYDEFKQMIFYISSPKYVTNNKMKK